MCFVFIFRSLSLRSTPTPLLKASVKTAWTAKSNSQHKQQKTHSLHSSIVVQDLNAFFLYRQRDARQKRKIAVLTETLDIGKGENQIYGTLSNLI